MSKFSAFPTTYFLFVLITLIGGDSHSQYLMSDNVRKANLILRDLVNTAILPGASAALLIEDEVVWSGQAGYTDIDKKTIVTKNTQFRTASVAKVITATALLKLIQEGRVDIDKDVRYYVPDFPQKKWIFTSRHLATHTSGIERDAADLEDKYYISIDESLDVFKDFPLLYQPGFEYLYSTHGYVLLSAVIEEASGKPFLTYLKEDIFDLLGITFTEAHNIHQANKSVATFYQRNGTTLEELVDLEDPSYMWGGGGLLSTASDLVNLGKAYFTGFISGVASDMAFDSHIMENGVQLGVGIGWRLSDDFADGKVAEHAGIMEGARSMLTLYPDEKIAVSFMTNRRWGTFGNRTVHILKHVLLSEDIESTLTRKSEYGGSYRGEQVNGRISIDKGMGSLTVPPSFKEWVVMPDLEELNFYYIKNDIWALVTPFGLLDLRLKKVGDAKYKGLVIFREGDVWEFTF